jgi:hypothetical protein
MMRGGASLGAHRLVLNLSGRRIEDERKSCTGSGHCLRLHGFDGFYGGLFCGQGGPKQPGQGRSDSLEE